MDTRTGTVWGQRSPISGRRAVRIALALTALAISTAVFAAPDPLRQPDLSSPRATLSSFLADSNKVIEDRRAGVDSTATVQATRRTFRALDFSGTPRGNSWHVRSERAAQLHEVLARIALPPAAQIPGKTEVAEENLAGWKIPGTSIEITRITEGRRAGEFVFSAGTVARIDRLFRRSRHRVRPCNDVSLRSMLQPSDNAGVGRLLWCKWSDVRVTK